MRLKIPISSSVRFNSYFTLVILVFLYITITNLIDGVGITASILYLLLVLIPTFLTWKENGTKMFFILFFKNFSSYFFLELLEKKSRNAHVKFGFYLFKQEFFYKTIFYKDNFLINSSTGQGSSLAGKDVNDWSTFIWYDHNDPIKSKRSQMLRYPDKDICSVGASGTKERVLLFHQELIDYLNMAQLYVVEDTMEDKDWS